MHSNAAGWPPQIGNPGILVTGTENVGLGKILELQEVANLAQGWFTVSSPKLESLHCPGQQHSQRARSFKMQSGAVKLRLEGIG